MSPQTIIQLEQRLSQVCMDCAAEAQKEGHTLDLISKSKLILNLLTMYDHRFCH